MFTLHISKSRYLLLHKEAGLGFIVSVFINISVEQKITHTFAL